MTNTYRFRARRALAQGVAGIAVLAACPAFAERADSAPLAATAAAAGADTTTDNATIVVTAPRQEEEARSRQKNAAVIVDVQAIETIRKYPDFNAAEALGRIPGISLSSDTGEGRFVNIRGIDANLNGATYGGVVLLNTFAAGTAASGSGRAVEFDTVPTGAIDGIVVYKTLSPDREAEGLGGQIDLTPRTARNITKPFIEIDLGAGYEPLHHHGGPYTASFAAGAKIGDVSFVINGSRKDDRRGVDDTEPSYVSGMVFDRVDFRRYDYSRRRFGYGGEVDYTPSEDHRYYARLDIAGYIERSLKNHFYAQFDAPPPDGNPLPVDAQGYVVDKFRPEVDVVNLQETHRNTVGAIGGEDHFGDLIVDYRAAYSRATYNEGYYHEARFFGNDNFYGRYNNLANPENFSYQFFNDAALTIPFVSTDATQYGAPNAADRSRGPVALSAFSEKDVDQEYSGVFNARYPLTLFGSVGEIKAGISIRRRDKVVNDFGGSGSASVNLSNYAQSVGPAETYYFGRYPTAPVANYGAIDTLVATLPPLQPSPGRDFKDTENVTAGYAMYTVDYGKLGVLAGVRVEATDASYGNFLKTTDTASNSTTSFVTNRNSYTNVFPTVQLKYAFSNVLQLRATYSTGIARPGFTQAGGNAGVDFSAMPPVFSAGNPNLKPTTGNNFDLDLEYYLPNGGIIQLGIFDKEFKNYIFANTITNVANPVFMGQNDGKGNLVTYFNESAYARGIELAYQQKFTFLPGWLGGFGMSGNLTLVKSRFLEYAGNGNGPDQYGSLPGTSNTTWNLAGFYERGPVNVRLAAEYVSASLFGLGGSQSTDVIQAERLTMDLTSSLRLTEHFQLYFAAKNLLDTPLRYDYGSPSRPQQIEYYGQTYEGGVRMKF